MKRIYSFMVAAVAMIAAAACTQELENVEPEVNGESVVFTAYADGADETKTALSGNKSLWQSGDRIWILNGKAGNTGWKKGYSTTDNSATATFTEEDNSYALEGTQYFAVYPAAAADNATWEGGDVLGVTLKSIQDATAGSYDPAAHIAVAQSNTTSLNFKNAVSLLKFTVRNEGVKSVTIYAREGGLLTGSCNISDAGYATPGGEANGWVELSAGEGTFAVGTEYYIAVFPNTELTAGFTVQFSFGGPKYDVKSYTKPLTLNRNDILDLGELEYTAAERTETVYLCPGVWNADEAWFAAYFFGTAGEATAVTMDENDGVYSCEVPGDYENVIFCRMNPEYGVFGWDVLEGETEVENHVWNKSADLNVPLKDAAEVYYNVTDWEAGEWSATPQESTPDVETKTYGICGDLTSWGETEDIPMALVDGKYVAYNVTFASAGGFKIRANKVWEDSDNWGLSATGAVEVGKYYDVITSGGSGNLTIIPGTYDIWFDLDNARIYIMEPGTSINTATKGTPIAPSSDVWYLVGEFNGWGMADQNYKFVNEAGWFVLKNCNISKGGGVKINDGTWGVQRTGSVGLYAPCALSSSGDNFNLPQGLYDIYMDTNASKIYVLFPGETPTTTGSYRLFVKNSTGQPDVYLHAWGGYSTSWPGVELTGTTNVDGYGTCSYLELQKGTNPIVNFLIHNGSEGNKTTDQNCSSLTILPTGDLYFEWK